LPAPARGHRADLRAQLHHRRHDPARHAGDRHLAVGHRAHEPIQPPPVGRAAGRARARVRLRAGPGGAGGLLQGDDAAGDELRVLVPLLPGEDRAPRRPTFAAAILFVFLLLAAMYESWRLPWAVLLGSPLVALGAFFGVWLAGYDNNV